MHNKALAGLARRQPEHGDRIECLVDFRVNPVAYLGIATDIGESYFPQCPACAFGWFSFSVCCAKETLP